MMQVLLAAPLPLASIVAWTTFNGMFRRAQKVLSLRAAVDLDWRDQVPPLFRIASYVSSGLWWTSDAGACTAVLDGQIPGSRHVEGSGAGELLRHESLGLGPGWAWPDVAAELGCGAAECRGSACSKHADTLGERCGVQLYLGNMDVLCLPASEHDTMVCQRITCLDPHHPQLARHAHNTALGATKRLLDCLSTADLQQQGSL